MTYGFFCGIDPGYGLKIFSPFFILPDFRISRQSNFRKISIEKRDLKRHRPRQNKPQERFRPCPGSIPKQSEILSETGNFTHLRFFYAAFTFRLHFTQTLPDHDGTFT